jgi:membrane protease YdiL (CAAX protease family)
MNLDNEQPNLDSTSEVVVPVIVPDPPRKITVREIFSWLVILSVVGFQFVTNVFDFSPKGSEDGKKVPVIEAEIEGKFLVFQRSLLDQQANGAAALEQLKINNRDEGSVQMRLARAILVAETESIPAALQAITELKKDIEDTHYSPTKKQERLLKVVSKLLQSRSANEQFSADDFPADESQLLIEEFGWIGELGLNPKATRDVANRKEVEAAASKTSVVLIGGLIGGLLWGIGGFVAAAVVAFMLLYRGFRPKCETQSGREVVYLETFAIWMVAIVLGQIAVAIIIAGFVHQAGGAREDILRNTLMVMPIVFLGSLLILFWPVLNGISFRVVRRDIGWYGNPIIESAWGFWSYLSGFPVLLFGFLMTLLVLGLMSFFSPPSNELAGVEIMGHPIQEELSNGGIVVGIVFFLTTVCAPIVEETFFRGVFYRYLRDSTRFTGAISRMTIAALTNSVIFAAIHPQGFAGIPVLTALAVVMSVLRESRGSLWGSMFIHAIHNFVVTLLAVLIMS